MFKIAIIGENYHQSEDALFKADAEIAKRGIMIRPPFKQRASQIEVTIFSGTNKFNCRVPRGSSIGNTVLVCDNTKIWKAVKIPYEAIIVLVNGKGYGSGGQIAVVGMG